MKTYSSTTAPNTTSKIGFEKLILKYWKWVIVVLAYSFLIYKLAGFNQYPELFEQLRATSGGKWGWLLGVFLLLPFNLLFESYKWKLLVARIQHISVLQAFKAFLAGISTGFFTPNRVGELVGRILFLKPKNRKAGATLSIVNSLTQNLIMAFCGIPAAVVFYLNKDHFLNAEIIRYISVLLIGLIALGGFLFLLPRLSRRINIQSRISAYVSFLSEYKAVELMKIIGVTLFRYFVFCVQFWFMLYFFGVDLTPVQALIAIPTTYLFVSFTPSFAFSEAAVRSSYAVIFIGAFSNHEIGIILAGISIWMVNFVIPMLFGSVVMVRKTE